MDHVLAIMYSLFFMLPLIYNGIFSTIMAIDSTKQQSASTVPIPSPVAVPSTTRTVPPLPPVSPVPRPVPVQSTQSHMQPVPLLTQEQQDKQQQQPSKASIAALIIILLIVCTIIIVGIYLTIKKYQLVGKALSKGDVATSALLLAPNTGYRYSYGPKISLF